MQMSRHPPGKRWPSKINGLLLLTEMLNVMRTCSLQRVQWDKEKEHFIGRLPGSLIIQQVPNSISSRYIPDEEYGKKKQFQETDPNLFAQCTVNYIQQPSLSLPCGADFLAVDAGPEDGGKYGLGCFYHLAEGHSA